MDNSRYLFRGKRLDNGAWVYGFYWNIPEHKDATYSSKPIVKSINNGIDYEIIAETLGKCTGLYAAKSYRGENLKDRLMFEGDRLRWTRAVLPKGEMRSGFVEWFIDSLFVRLDNKNDYDESINRVPISAAWCRDDCEIIGTVFDEQEGA